MKKLGCGLGLRTELHPHLLEQQLSETWLKICSEDYMDSGGQPLVVLERLRKKFPLALQGRALSIGSSDPINEVYLKSLQVLIQRVQPVMVCDYLCWTSTDQNYLHELLPLPMNREVLDHVAERVEKTQELLQQKMILGNIAHYASYQQSEYSEWEFLNELTKRTGCGICLDLNSVYVNSFNHGFKAKEYIGGIHSDSIACIQVSGYTDMGSWLLNSHLEPVGEPVWDLYRECLKRMGKIPTIVESNQPVEEFDDVRQDFSKANQIYATSKSKVSAQQSQPSPRAKKKESTTVHADRFGRRPTVGQVAYL